MNEIPIKIINYSKVIIGASSEFTIKTAGNKMVNKLKKHNITF
jgi:hypothetical protein